MYRRLYFLLPDEQHAREVMQDLADAGVRENSIHAHQRTRQGDARDADSRASWQRLDRAEKVEAWAWRADLLIFFLALAGLGFALWMDSLLLAIVSLAVMLVTFMGGNLYAELVPRVHLQEFEHALSHGEVLLMLDVEHSRVAEIEQRVQGKHPEAVAGGSSWTLPSLGI